MSKTLKLNVKSIYTNQTRVLTVPIVRVIGTELLVDTTDPAASQFGVHVEGITGWVSIDGETYRRVLEALNAT